MQELKQYSSHDFLNILEEEVKPMQVIVYSRPVKICP